MRTRVGKSRRSLMARLRLLSSKLVLFSSEYLNVMDIRQMALTIYVRRLTSIKVNFSKKILTEADGEKGSEEECLELEPLEGQSFALLANFILSGNV